jgi:hypothetical protein
LVDDALDEIMHGATQGAAGAQAALRVWTSRASPQLEATLGGLLARGFAIHVTSDHGHVEAQGSGQPSEGVTVQTRGRRARVYADERFARSVQRGFPDTILWEQDPLLPPSTWVLMPRGRAAFARSGELVVTHGGPTLDEVVVPLVTITSG